MSKKIIALIMLLCIVLTGCGKKIAVTEQDSRTEISLAWWGNDARTAYTLEAVRKFETKHPDIKVNVRYSEWSGYEARNKIQMISGRESDVMLVNFAWLSEFSKDGNGYYDLNELKDIVDIDAFDKDMLEYGMRAGKLNAIPIAMNAETMYIDKTIYDKYSLDIPETWDDYFEAAKVMSKDGIYPLSGVAKAIWMMVFSYGEQVTGKSFFSKTGELQITPDDFKVMIDFYDRLVDEKVIPAVEYYDRLSLENGTYAGSIAWISDAMNYYKDRIDKGNEIVVAPYPHLDGMTSGSRWYAKPATLYAISKNVEHPKEAAMLLEYLLNSEDVALLQGTDKGVPLSDKARNILNEHDGLKGLQYDASLQMEDNESIEPMNPAIEDGGVIDMFIAACDKVVFNKATSDVAAKELYNELTTPDK